MGMQFHSAQYIANNYDLPQNAQIHSNTHFIVADSLPFDHSPASPRNISILYAKKTKQHSSNFNVKSKNVTFYGA